ncbi:MAG: SUMF1/EgtB/PvdO family nonheme iron enzyme [Bacteroides sp.]|nr:SUMF1/EgtB/PvdO family nonheme iron enzyme [Bacteroides sp.]MCM1086147.1 SUMF1/EgtB/PvdO family nonheme iron enzyme [Bacteroides sp.]
MRRVANLWDVRNLTVAVFAAILLWGCSNAGSGELVGVAGRKSPGTQVPFGMVYVPGGSFVWGAGGFDPSYQMLNIRTVTISDFFMDETEITNNEYRQFVEYVKEYHTRRLLAENGIEGFQIENEDEDAEPEINWKTKIKRTPEVEEALADLYLPVEERFAHRKEIDVRKLNYEYWSYDFYSASRKSWNQDENEMPDDGVYYGSFVSRPQSMRSRQQFMQKHVVNVYPDTLCWIFDWSYSYNDPMVAGYFSSPLYDNYPVVGVNWKQAEAFCKWRSKIYNDAMMAKGYPETQEFRLPTEAQWEYAARGGLDASPYPWGGNYARNINGCLLGNFKPGRGDYSADGSLYPCIVGHYSPNDYGLYDMMGNVSEWCIDAYDESIANNHDFNPVFTYDAKPEDGVGLKRKVVRGGSFKDFADICKVYYRSFEYQDTCKSYVGFRCIQPLLASGMLTGGSGSNVY